MSYIVGDAGGKVTRSPRKRRRWTGPRLPSTFRGRACVLAALVLVAYLSSLPGGFVWLDHSEIESAGYRAESAAEVLQMFGSTLEQYQDRHSDATTSGGGYWRPLYGLSISLDWFLFGEEAWLYHLENMQWHAATVIALYWLAAQLLRQQPDGDLLAFWATALFAVHPLGVHSVTWVSGRKDVLAAGLAIAALAAFVQLRPPANEKQARPLGYRAAWMTLCIVLFAAALMSKEPAVVMPLVATWLVLVDLPGSAASTTSIRQRFDRTTLLCLSLLWGIVAAWALFRSALFGGVVLQAERPSDNALVNIATSARLAWHYIGRVLAPWDPTISDTWWVSDPLDWLDALAILGVLLLLALAVRASRRWGGPWALGLVWYLLWKLPSSGLFPLRHLHAERYLYPASWGLLLLVVAALWRWWPKDRVPLLRRLILPAAVAVLAAMTFWQNTYWIGDRTLWEHAIVQDPAYVEGHVGLASVALDEAKTAKTEAKAHAALTETIEHSQAAIASAALPRHVGYFPAFIAHTNLGLAHYYLHQHDAARENFEVAIDLHPNHAVARYHLGLVAMAQQQYADAALYFEQALQLNPLDYLAASNLARCVLLLGDYQRAAELYQTLVAAQPDDLINLGNYVAALMMLDRHAEALPAIQKLVKLKPEIAAYKAKLALCLWRTGQREAALQALAEAQEMDPDDPTVRSVATLMAAE